MAPFSVPSSPTTMQQLREEEARIEYNRNFGPKNDQTEINATTPPTAQDVQFRFRDPEDVLNESPVVLPKGMFNKTPLSKQEQEDFRALPEEDILKLEEFRGTLSELKTKEFESFIDNPPLEALEAVQAPLVKIVKAYMRMREKGYEPDKETLLEWAHEFTGLAQSSRALRFIVNTLLLRPKSEDITPPLHRPVLVLDPNKVNYKPGPYENPTRPGRPSGEGGGGLSVERFLKDRKDYMDKNNLTESRSNIIESLKVRKGQLERDLRQQNKIDPEAASVTREQLRQFREYLRNFDKYNP